MKLRTVSTIAAGLLVAAIPTFSQTPPAHPTMDKTQEKAEHKEQWKDCMARMESKEKGASKTEGQHKGEGKAAGTGKVAEGKGTEKPAAASEGKKMNRHEEMMQDCRNQLYGGRHEEPGNAGKEGAATHN